MRAYLKETAIPKFMERVNGLGDLELEDALINLFISDQQIRTKQDAFIQGVLEELHINLDIETLIYIFEALLEDHNVVEHGIVFTPKYIASYICREIWREVSQWSADISPPVLFRSSTQLKNAGIISKVFAIEYAELSFDTFAEDIIKIYSERYKIENIQESDQMARVKAYGKDLGKIAEK